MEDVRLARETSREEHYRAVTDVASVIANQDDKRFSIILQNIGANDVWVGFTNGVAVNAGMLFTSRALPILINLSDYGQIVGRGLYAICAAGLTSNLAVWETTLEAE